MSERGRAHEERVGQLVNGKYRLSRVLGCGGMGVVFEARHELIGRRFALKFLHPELAIHEQILSRFRREAHAAGALESENITAVTDVGTAEDGAPYIVMEFLQGEDLGRLLARLGPLPVPRAVHAVIQACRGLAAAHAQGITHRDLKPENLFLIKRGDGADLIKVLDFGIAKLKQADDAGPTTRTGMTFGTPHYMSPEQARGAKELDQRADIYALGVILYELLSAHKPFSGDSYNAILYQVLTQAPLRLETLRANLPPGLADTVHRAMAAEPAQRYATASELAAALASYVERAVAPIETGEHSPDAIRTAISPGTALVGVGATDSGVSGESSASRGASRATPNARIRLTLLAVALTGSLAALFAGHRRASSQAASTPDEAAAAQLGPSQLALDRPVEASTSSGERTPGRPPDSSAQPATPASALPSSPASSALSSAAVVPTTTARRPLVTVTPKAPHHVAVPSASASKLPSDPYAP